MLSLGMMCLLSLSLVSAATVSNVETSYDKKSNDLTVDFDLIVKNECIGTVFNVFDRKGREIGSSNTWVPGQAIPISCIKSSDGVIRWGAKTGTFHKSYEIDLDKRPRGRFIEYEIRHYSDILEEGKIITKKPRRFKR